MQLHDGCSAQPHDGCVVQLRVGEAGGCSALPHDGCVVQLRVGEAGGCSTQPHDGCSSRLHEGCVVQLRVGEAGGALPALLQLGHQPAATATPVAAAREGAGKRAASSRAVARRSRHVSDTGWLVEGGCGRRRGLCLGDARRRGGGGRRVGRAVASGCSGDPLAPQRLLGDAHAAPQLAVRRGGAAKGACGHRGALEGAAGRGGGALLGAAWCGGALVYAAWCGGALERAARRGREGAARRGGALKGGAAWSVGAVKRAARRGREGAAWCGGAVEVVPALVLVLGACAPQRVPGKVVVVACLVAACSLARGCGGWLQQAVAAWGQHLGGLLRGSSVHEDEEAGPVQDDGTLCLAMQQQLRRARLQQRHLAVAASGASLLWCRLLGKA